MLRFWLCSRSGETYIHIRGTYLFAHTRTVQFITIARGGGKGARGKSSKNSNSTDNLCTFSPHHTTPLSFPSPATSAGGPPSPYSANWTPHRQVLGKNENQEKGIFLENFSPSWSKNTTWRGASTGFVLSSPKQEPTSRTTTSRPRRNSVEICTGSLRTSTTHT